MGRTSKRLSIDRIDFVEPGDEEPMAPGAAGRALVLFARWAARRARRIAVVKGGDGDGLVTRVLSNGCKLGVAEN
ncbi:MAG: hypothetical protein ACYSUC_01345 [Planctomycetota bacterium]|jgi:hypothetical protein